jgi:hypothetical protein
MGDSKTTLWNEIGQGFGKLLIWAAYIAMAVLAKIAADSRVARLTRRDIIIKTILSVFVGVLAAIACENFGYRESGKIIVPVATLLGEGIVVYVMTNWRRLIAKLMPNLFPTDNSKKKDKEI